MLFMLMLCITGLPLIFKSEIVNWVSPPPAIATVVQNAPTPSLEELAQQALSVRPQGHLLVSMGFPEDRPETVRITTSSIGSLPSPGMYTQTFDLRNGELLQHAAPARDFIWVMRELHVSLFAGVPGMLFLGFFGLLVFIAVLSGVVIYAPFMRKLDFGTLRAERGPRLLWLDLHNLLGIVTVAWLAVVTLTGVINTLASPLTGYWKATDMEEAIATLRHLPPVEQRISAEQALSAARSVMPEMTVFNLIFPHTALSSPHHFSAMYRGNTPLTKRLLLFALIDARTGDVSFVRMPWHMKALFLSQPLHFGDYGGLPLKIIWSLLTLVTILVLGSGIYLWLKKPGGKKGKPKSRQVRLKERQEQHV